MYDIKASNVGEPVSARRINRVEDQQWGFVVDHYEPGMVLAEDMQSLRWPNDTELLGQEREAMVLTRYQARAALLNAALLADVEALMADANTPEDIKLMWAHKERIRRLHPATIQMAEALGWTEMQLDDLFRAGMAIEA